MNTSSFTSRIAALTALLALSIGALEATANESIPPGGVCGYIAFNSIQPTQVTAEFLEQLRILSGATTVRHIQSNEAYTFDERHDRLNVFSDKENFYLRHKCG